MVKSLNLPTTWGSNFALRLRGRGFALGLGALPGGALAAGRGDEGAAASCALGDSLMVNDCLMNQGLNQGLMMVLKP